MNKSKEYDEAVMKLIEDADCYCDVVINAEQIATAIDKIYEDRIECDCADTIKDLQDDLELEKDVLTIRDDEIIELKDKIKELEEETKKHKKTIQDWKDGNYVSIHALRVFIEDYNSGCDEGQEIDTDSADYFCECLDPVIED